MGKTFRIRVLFIALIFVAITIVGIVISVTFQDVLPLNALYYGSGTEDDPYRIYSSTQFYNLQEIVVSNRAEELTKGKHFKLYSNIELLRSAKNYGKGFFGTLDGNGYTIDVYDYGLFYDLQDGATIKNLNINFNYLGDREYSTGVYALCYEIHKGATVENCHMYGNINIKVKKITYLTFKAYYGVFSIYNYGVIKDCSYTGRITNTDVTLCARLYVGVMCLNINGGEVRNCTVNCDMDILLNGAAGVNIYGVAYNCSNSSFNGSIAIRPHKKISINSQINVYGLGKKSDGGEFNGNMTSYDMSRFTRLVFALSADEYSNIHNGEIIRN